MRSEEKNELHNYYNPLRYSTYMFGRIAAPVQTKCPNIYVRLSKRNVHVVWTRACMRACPVTHTYFSRTAWTSIPEEFHLQVGASESKRIIKHTLTHSFTQTHDVIYGSTCYSHASLLCIYGHVRQE